MHDAKRKLSLTYMYIQGLVSRSYERINTVSKICFHSLVKHIAALECCTGFHVIVTGFVQNNVFSGI